MFFRTKSRCSCIAETGYEKAYDKLSSSKQSLNAAYQQEGDSGMNKMIRIIGALVVILCMAVSFSGCGSSGETGGSDGSGSGNAVKIKIKDIDWNVEEGVADGERCMLLDYTNNTKYTITSFDITFKEKADVTEEEAAEFRSDIKKKFEGLGLDEDDEEDLEELLDREISMHAETAGIVDPGESVSNINCYYYSGYMYVRDINHYNLVEPDIATVKYIDDDRIHTVYYDYGSKKYSAETDTEVAYQWSDTKLASKIPEPDVKVLECSIDDEETFSFDAYGMTLDKFDAYVNKIKELGYTVDPSSYEGFYSADNAEGYNIYLSYDETDNSMYVSFDAPDAE